MARVWPEYGRSLPEEKPGEMAKVHPQSVHIDYSACTEGWLPRVALYGRVHINMQAEPYMNAESFDRRTSIQYARVLFNVLSRSPFPPNAADCTPSEYARRFFAVCSLQSSPQCSPECCSLYTSALLWLPICRFGLHADRLYFLPLFLCTPRCRRAKRALVAIGGYISPAGCQCCSALCC